MSNYIGHCNECAYAIFAEDEQITSGQDWRKLYAGEARRVTPEGANVAYGVYGRCPSNHKAFRLHEVKGKFNPDHPCDDRCLNAKGNDCSCSCGGANHGRGHAVQIVQASLPAERPAPQPNAPITELQIRFITALLNERVLDEDAEADERKRADSFSKLETITRKQASAWIDKLKTLPKASKSA